VGTTGDDRGYIGEGNYASVMTMAGVPQLNVVRADAKHFPPDIKYVATNPERTPSTANEVDPATVDDPTLPPSAG